MASYDQLITMAGNSAFQQRVRYALAVGAVAVYSEVSSSTGHTPRLAMATAVLQGNYSPAPMALAVLTNPTIAAEATFTSDGYNIPDSDLQFAVNSLWNALANA